MSSVRKIFCIAVLALHCGFYGACLNANAFEYDELVHLIQEKKLTTIEDVLAQMPLSYRSRFVLMYKSRSAQGASLENPRAILYGDDASFISAFNGDPLHEGFNDLEMIQWKAATSRFEFRRIRFREGESPQFSQANPRECMGCHQGSRSNPPDPRPNWDSYFAWAGAYAGLDNGFRDRAQMRQYFDLSGKDEYKHFTNFVKASTAHPRYRSLGNQEQGSVRESSRFYPDFWNTGFTGRVFYLNHLRMARILMETPDYAHWKYALAGAKLCGLESLLPLKVKVKFTQSKADVSRGIKNAQYYSAFLDFQTILVNRGLSLDWNNLQTTFGNFLMENAVLLDGAAKAQPFLDGIFTSDDNSAQLIGSLAIIDPELRGIFSNAQYDEHELLSYLNPLIKFSEYLGQFRWFYSLKSLETAERVCPLLREKSLKALVEIPF